MRLVRPRTVPVASGGQLAAGVRANTTNVGLLGSPSLTVLNPGDTLTGPLGGGAASWSGNNLIIGASGVTLNGYRINAGVYCGGTNLTFVNGRVVAPNDVSVLYALFTELGDLTVTDSTVFGGNGSQLVIGTGSGAGRVFATRCDLSGSEDGIGLSGASRISQCYIHDLLHRVDAHVDGIQSYSDNGLIVEHSYIDVRGIHESACATSNGPNSTFNNNFMYGGDYFLRFETTPSPGASNGTVTNNDFGTLVGTEAAEVHQETGGMITTFTNNRRGDGSLISSPS